MKYQLAEILNDSDTGHNVLFIRCFDEATLLALTSEIEKRFDYQKKYGIFPTANYSFKEKLNGINQNYLAEEYAIQFLLANGWEPFAVSPTPKAFSCRTYSFRKAYEN